jgi:hypothetical protein
MPGSLAVEGGGSQGETAVAAEKLTPLSVGRGLPALFGQRVGIGDGGALRDSVRAAMKKYVGQ